MDEEKQFKQMALFYTGLAMVAACAASLVQSSEEQLSDVPASLRVRWMLVQAELVCLAREIKDLAFKETV
jgi:hypothetical protein